MIVPVSGFGKGDQGLELDVERMANGNMADGKCVPASKDGVETKAPEKTGALQKLRRFGCCIVIWQWLFGREHFYMRPLATSRLFSNRHFLSNLRLSSLQMGRLLYMTALGLLSGVVMDSAQPGPLRTSTTSK